jgi:stage 0 sporulation regulatory protein
MENITTNHNHLHHNINTLRMEMISVGILRGFTHPETIEYSQALDKLIIQAQRQYSVYTQ